jgi:hypothetical protein
VVLARARDAESRGCLPFRSGSRPRTTPVTEPEDARSVMERVYTIQPKRVASSAARAG